MLFVDTSIIHYSSEGVLILCNILDLLIYSYIIDFAMDAEWDDLKRREQLRALFTSWCFIFGVDADTKECD